MALWLIAVPGWAQGTGSDSAYTSDLVDVKPALVFGPAFRYTPEQIARRISGRVLLRFVVDTLGRVEPMSLSIVDTPDSGLNAASREFARGLLFRPAAAHGRLVRALVELPIDVNPPRVAPPLDSVAALHRGDTTVFPVESVFVKPDLLSHPPLVFPRSELEAGRDGLVMVQGIIDTTGHMERASVRVLSTPGPVFSQEAERIVLHSRYRPASIAGRPVRVRIQIPVNFALPGYACRHRGESSPEFSPAPLFGPAPNGVVLITEVDDPPTVLSHPKVRYPEPQARMGIEGTAVVEVIVDTAGNADPTSIKLRNAPDPAFGNEAIRVVRASRFTPGRVHGQPVPTLMVMPVHFQVRCR